MYRHPDYAIDGIRSALGLAVENMYAYGVVMDTEIPKLDELTQESIEMLRDMEGEYIPRYPPMSKRMDSSALTLEELGEKLRR